MGLYWVEQNRCQNFQFFIFRFNICSKKNRTQPKHLYNIHNPPGIKSLTRLRLGLSHSNEHKFNHEFDDCVNIFWNCSLEPESISQFFLHCHHYNSIPMTLFDVPNSLDQKLFKISDKELNEGAFDMIQMNFSSFLQISVWLRCMSTMSECWKTNNDTFTFWWVFGSV